MRSDIDLPAPAANALVKGELNVNITSNGISLFVDQKGKGELALVFLHYWGGSSRTWKYVTGELATSYQTIAIDFRGWGQSEAPNVGYTLANMSSDIEGVIKTLNPRRYVLVGHSMGGKIAQLMASLRPAGLAGLVLVAPSPPTPMNLPAAVRESMASAYSSREAVEATIDNVLTAKPLSAEIREQVIKDSLKGAPTAKFAWPQHMSQEDISGHIARIAVPTVVIAGEQDKVDTLDVLRTELMVRMPRAEMHVLAGTGHLLMLESPREVAALIRDFCENLTRRNV
ncbi:alpha/beta hydrolase [Ochrobactrum sp. MC-1LL]|uniref:alpha/beta fold hydrolase n=1 Tax=Ochrobactrum sp. MC-1LL TaxID=2735351 RepID=UPI0015808B08|nr:alpha/beta hydrolase [Ochrobactrum sp. MC-1LL]